jgi:hypothetical protein
METNIRLMDASSINITGGAVAGNGNLNYSMVINTYYQE